MTTLIGLDTDIAVACIPGRFDADDATWQRHVNDAADDTLAGVPVTVIVLTETTRRRLPRVACPPGWRWLRKWAPFGASNVSILVRSDRWSVAHFYAFLSSDVKVRTKLGRLRPPHYALVACLLDLLTSKEMLLAGEHWPLRNTARRQEAYDQAQDNADEMWAEGRAVLPNAVRLWVCDWNLNIMQRALRVAWTKAFPRFTPSWLGDEPGWKSVIDWVAAGKGLEVLDTEWHRRPKADGFDHNWSVTLLRYNRLQSVPPVVEPPVEPPVVVPPVVVHPTSHACPYEWCGAIHTTPPPS